MTQPIYPDLESFTKLFNQPQFNTANNKDYLTGLQPLAARHYKTITHYHYQFFTHTLPHIYSTWLRAFTSPNRMQQLTQYQVDAGQRSVLFWDTLRRRGNTFVQHEEAGCPPVLAFDYEILVDGRTLDRPVNYALVKILPPPGVITGENRRPYIIIDPRAGHGSGIGGFKHDSEVGVALRDGHPVYFVIFFTHPEPEQTLADVCAAEAIFTRTVIERHPNAPKPIIMGNCQGGWAVMLLAASYPEITGPVVVNGSPLSYWAGCMGKNPMRYLGGLVGGVWPALLASDLGNGKFDGANLVLNFESLNPANTWWRKYYDVYSRVDTEMPRYLEFERWWSGFYFMNKEEIRWIVDNLFVGNKLARGQATLDGHNYIDLRHIRAPIIVFASHGDNITPPQQALNWILDAYRNEHEIKVRGQRIVYTLHEEIGHLGIFVSSTVAQKEHQQIVSTLKTIEALAPGLYEMVITDHTGEGLAKQFTVAFEERHFDDILALGDGRRHEEAFPPIARLSELTEELYEIYFSPAVKMLANAETSKILVSQHPLRARRYLLSDKNMLLKGLPKIADKVRTKRQPAQADNFFVEWEKLNADLIEQSLNFYRDSRDTWLEFWFHAFYGSPIMKAFGKTQAAPRQKSLEEDLRELPEVQSALDRIDEGGYAAAVIRMLIMLAHARGAVRRNRLERSSRMLNNSEPFASMGMEKRNRLIAEQTIIVDIEYEKALNTLPLLLSNNDERRQAIQQIVQIAGPLDEMNLATLAMLEKLKNILAAHVANPDDADILIHDTAA